MEVLISEFHSFVEDRCRVECLTISVNYQIISRVSTNIVKPTKSLKKSAKISSRLIETFLVGVQY